MRRESVSERQGALFAYIACVLRTQHALRPATGRTGRLPSEAAKCLPPSRAGADAAARTGRRPSRNGRAPGKAHPLRLAFHIAFGWGVGKAQRRPAPLPCGEQFPSLARGGGEWLIAVIIVVCLERLCFLWRYALL